MPGGTGVDPATVGKSHGVRAANRLWVTGGDEANGGL